MKPNSSNTGKRRKNRARGALAAPSLAADVREEVEAIVGHRFKTPELLDRALTHRSAAQGRAATWSNERLEFLGDRILGLVIVETLLERHPEAREGELAPRLNAVVSRETCALVGAEIGLGPYLFVDSAEKKSGGAMKPSLLANAVEAVIGAVYQDAGLTPARKIVLKLFKPHLAGVAVKPSDAKSALQEWAQGQGLAAPTYVAEGREGPDHAPVFKASVTVFGYATAVGLGSSKQTAERAAAQALMALITSEESNSP